MNKVGILGSCVTRDVFQDLQDYEIAFYIARGSLASIYAPVWTVEGSPEQLQVARHGTFENRMLRYDLNKEAAPILRDGGDFPLLVDFIDERFDVFVRDTSVITRSNYLMQTEYGKSLTQARLLRRNTDEAKQLWTTAARAFCKDVRGRPILLHRAYWAEAYMNDDTGEICAFNDADLQIVAQQNALLRFYYDFIVDIFDAVEVIDPDPALVYSNFAHRWGRDFFHFSDAYYQDIGGKISKAMTRIRQNTAAMS